MSRRPWGAALQRYHTAAAVAAVLVCAWVAARAFLEGGVPATHDSPAHYTYLYLFDGAIGQGQFPVRWIEWVRPGNGQPLFNFYQPGLYYLAEITHLFVPSLEQSLRLTVLAAWGLGALCTWLLLRPLGIPAAAAAAGTFILAPYLALDLFVRGAYPEFVAIGFAPAVLWAADRTVSGGRARHALPLAALLAVMAICHLPTLMMFSPVFLTAAIARLRSARAVRGELAALAGACALAGGLAAFYVLPALTEIDAIRMHELTSDYFDFHNHFVEPRQWFDYAWGYGGSVPGPGDDMSFQVGVVQWLIIAAACVAAGSRAVGARFRTPSTPSSAQPSPVVWLAIVVATLFLMTRSSTAIWEHVTPLAFVQFPWRLLMVVTVACAVLAGRIVALVPSKSLQTILAVALVGAQLYATRDYREPSDYLRPGQIDIDNVGWRHVNPARSAAFLEEGYRPMSVRQVPEPGVGRWDVVSGTGDVRAVRDQDASLLLQVETAAGLELRINTPHFPGWRVHVDGREMPPRPDETFGFLHVTVPPGTHRVEASFGDTSVRTLANRISLAAAVFLILCAAAIGMRRFGGRRASSAPASQKLV